MSSPVVQNLSIYIPRVFGNITEDRIKACFRSLNLGEISRVDFVDREASQNDEYKTKMAFIHFKEWNDTPCVRNLHEKIMDPKENAKIVYDDPYYWVLLPNKNPKPEFQIENEVMFQFHNNIMTQLHERLTKIEEQLYKKSTIKNLQHPLNLPPISLPLENGQIETDPMTNIDYVCSNVENGDPIWTEHKNDNNNQEEEEEETPEWSGVTEEDIVEAPVTLQEMHKNTIEWNQTESSAPVIPEISGVDFVVASAALAAEAKFKEDKKKNNNNNSEQESQPWGGWLPWSSSQYSA